MTVPGSSGVSGAATTSPYAGGLAGAVPNRADSRGLMPATS